MFLNGCRFLVLLVTLFVLLNVPTVVAEEDSLQCDPNSFQPIDFSPEVKFPELKGRPRAEKISWLLQVLDQKNFQKQQLARMALREISDETDVPNFISILKQGPSLAKKIAIIESLEKIKDRRVAEALRFEVERGEPEAKRVAITALAALSFDWPVPIIADALKNGSDYELQKRAASALAIIGSPQALYAAQNSFERLDRKPDPRVLNTLNYAIDYIKSKGNRSLTSTDMPAGRNLKLSFKGSDYFLYYPALKPKSSNLKHNINPRMLVCIHDESLEIEKLFSKCKEIAREKQMAVLVPLFDNISFPDYSEFNLGHRRSDIWLLELISHVSEIAEIEKREIYMYGRGKGGDFVQRFAMVCPNRIAKAAALVENFVEPTTRSFFPNGFSTNPLAPEMKVSLSDFAKTDFVYMSLGGVESRKIRRYVEQLYTISELKGIHSRIAFREFFEDHKTSNLEEAAFNYLFQEN